MMEDILKIMDCSTVIIRHVYKEANQLADNIANSAFYTSHNQQFRTFMDLPSLARRILNIDKHQISSIRISTKSQHQNKQGIC